MRRTQYKIMSDILDVIPVPSLERSKYVSITYVAKHSGSTWRTAKQYLSLLCDLGLIKRMKVKQRWKYYYPSTLERMWDAYRHRTASLIFTTPKLSTNPSNIV